MTNEKARNLHNGCTVTSNYQHTADAADDDDDYDAADDDDDADDDVDDDDADDDDDYDAADDDDDADDDDADDDDDQKWCRFMGKYGETWGYLGMNQQNVKIRIKTGDRTYAGINDQE